MCVGPSPALEQDYSEIEKWPMESRAREEVQCPHCRIMQNSRVGLQQHIARRHAGSSSGPGDNNNGNTDTQDHGALAATGGTDGQIRRDNDMRHGSSGRSGNRSSNNRNNDGDTNASSSSGSGSGSSSTGGGAGERRRRGRSPYLLRSQTPAFSQDTGTQDGATGDTQQHTYNLRSRRSRAAAATGTQ